jgi:long-chain fatty acid transport protein
MRKGFVYSCTALTVLIGQAFAGGLYLNEVATPSMGVSGAGAQAVANDASTAFHNPAGMTRIDGDELMLGVGILEASVEFDPSPNTPVVGNDGGDAGGWGPILGAYYVHSLSDDWKFGVNVVSISAAVLDYDDGWAGRYLVDEITIMTLSVMPGVAYRVNDELSLGAGANIMYGTMDMDVSVPPPGPGPDGKAELDDVNDADWGYNFSAVYEFNEKTRAGLVYMSEIEMELDGDVDISPIGIATGVDTEVPFVQLVRLGVYHDINDRVALLGTVGWEDWSSMDDQVIYVGPGESSIKRNWDDTYHFSLGMHYRASEKWLLQTGWAYDTSPTDAKDRLPDMPMDRQWRISGGAIYDLNERISVGGALTYADYGDASIQNTDSNGLVGSYKENRIIFAALHINWKL